MFATPGDLSPGFKHADRYDRRGGPLAAHSPFAGGARFAPAPQVGDGRSQDRQDDEQSRQECKGGARTNGGRGNGLLQRGLFDGVPPRRGVENPRSGQLARLPRRPCKGPPAERRVTVVILHQGPLSSQRRAKVVRRDG